MNLAEIIAEGERLDRMYRKGPSFWGSDAKFRADTMAVLPRLLAVAKAAVEMRESYRALCGDTSDAATDRFIRSLLSFDAAAGGKP